METSQFGHDLPLGRLLHSCRSIQDLLQTGHSIAAGPFVGPNFGNAAVGANGDADGMEFERPVSVNLPFRRVEFDSGGPPYLVGRRRQMQFANQALLLVDLPIHFQQHGQDGRENDL